jgi:hypothetical protein
MSSNNIKIKDIEIEDVETLLWHGMTFVRISDVRGFGEWLEGQTMPLVEDNETPTDWAYLDDFIRYTRHLPIID